MLDRTAAIDSLLGDKNVRKEHMNTEPNKKKDYFVEEARNAEAFEATLEDIVTGFRSGKLEDWRTVRMTIDGEYKWSTVGELCKNERVQRSGSKLPDSQEQDAPNTSPPKETPKKRSNPIIVVLIGIFIAWLFFPTTGQGLMLVAQASCPSLLSL
jgi:hypothetical protein